MAGQAGNPTNHTISPHVIGGAFVQQYYQILHEQPEQAHKFYQDSSILGRPDSNSNGSMMYVSTMSEINEKIMSMDVRNCLTEIETADAQLSHKDGVLIVVTGSLTSDEGVFRRFTQSFFLAPQESGGYFVLTDIFRFISERKPSEINQIAAQENEISQNGRPASETYSALPEPIPADRSVISDHVTAESNVTERKISDSSANGTATDNNVKAQPPLQVPKEDPKKALVAAPPPPTQTDVTKKSYASIVKVTKEGPPTPAVAKTTASISKQKPAPKPVSKAVEGPEKPSVKPTQAIETGDGIVAQNNSTRNEQGYSIFVKNLPFHANIEMVEEEFKKFGTIKPGGVQVRHNKVDRYVFGFVEYESQQSMQAAIEASPVLMEDREVGIEAKRANSRGGRFQSGRGVYHGDNFRGRGSGFVDNANYRSSDNFNRRNEGEMYNRRNEGEFYNRRNDGGENYIRRNDGGENYNSRNDGGENYNRRNDGGENYNRRNDGGENYNRRNDGGENYNRRNDGGQNYNRRNDGGGENFNRRNDGGGENFNRRNDGGGENFNHRNDGGGENFNRRNDGGGENFNRRNDGGGENFNRRNDGGGENFNRRNDGGGENFNRRNDGGENFNRRNNFRNQNEFPGRGRAPPPPGNNYHQNGNGVHPSRPYQNGNARFNRVNNGPKQAPVAA